jgi:CRISPR type III-B/RAMP module-associated protein Cmr3
LTGLRVRIEPIEPLLFGDNRSARVGESHVLGDQDPSPATLFGAIGARIAHCLNVRGERDWAAAEPVLGPFEADAGSAPDGRRTAELMGYGLADPEGRLWFPQPLHLRVEREGKGTHAVEALRPADTPVLSSLPTGWRPLTASVEMTGEVDTPLLLAEATLEAVLSGTLEMPFSLGRSARERQDFYAPEPRLGVAIGNAANTALPGRLFARPYRRFSSAVRPEGGGWESSGFLAWFRVLDLAGASASAFDGTAFLGGDRRRARVRFELEAEPFLPRILDAVKAQAAASRGYLTYLLTPARLPTAGPIGFAGETPVGGAAGRPLFVSGWSSAARAKGPRPMQALLPAGSVLFFEWGPERRDAASRERWIEERWFTALTPEGSREGFGRVLLGVWS